MGLHIFHDLHCRSVTVPHLSVSFVWCSVQFLNKGITTHHQPVCAEGSVFPLLCLGAPPSSGTSKCLGTQKTCNKSSCQNECTTILHCKEHLSNKICDYDCVLETRVVKFNILAFKKEKTMCDDLKLACS